jgi:hypothetical protein
VFDAIIDLFQNPVKRLVIKTFDQFTTKPSTYFHLGKLKRYLYVPLVKGSSYDIVYWLSTCKIDIFEMTQQKNG